MAFAWATGALLFGAGLVVFESEPPSRTREALLIADALLGQVACFALLPLLRRRGALPGDADTQDGATPSSDTSVNGAAEPPASSTRAPSPGGAPASPSNAPPSLRGPFALILAALAFSTVSSWSLFVTCYALFKVGERRRPREIAAAGVVVLLAQVVNLLLYGTEGLTLGELATSLVAFTAVAAGLVLGGMYRGSRRALLDSSIARAETLQREQAAIADRTRAEERLIIAREMHHTLSHRLAVISLHSGGLASRSRQGPVPGELVTTTVELIQATAQEASVELRELLLALRDNGGDTRMPLTLQDVPRVVDDARAAGVNVPLSYASDVRERAAELPVQRSVSLAIAVQEGIANAMKHAPGAPVRVTISADETGVAVQVSNPIRAAAAPYGAAPGGGAPHHPTPLAGGHGLIGLAERLRLAAGTLNAGERGDEFHLRAWVPWR